MRVLILPSWYPTAARPVSGIFIRAQAEALSARHNVYVMHLDVLPRTKQLHIARHAARRNGYTEETIEVLNLPVVWQFLYVLVLLRAYRRLRSTFAPDVVNCQVAVPAGWGGAFLKLIFKVPVVLTEHNGQFESLLARRGTIFMARVAYRAADIVLAVGQDQSKTLARLFPNIKRLEIVPNPVDTTRFKPSALPVGGGVVKFLFVGLLDPPPVKGLQYLLQALAIAKRTSQMKIHLDVVGQGSMLEGYRAQAAELELEGDITFHGRVDHHEMPTMYRNAHALVISSLSESQSVVALEALASGRPVVTTRCGGPEYFVTARSGLTVRPGDPHELAAAMVQLAENLGDYRPEEIAASTEPYTFSSYTNRMTEIYESLFAGHKKRV